ncbi:hypothetical protein [Streptomyces sp. H39-S7]|uniref:hypothetical protein n=1 Tax=Streptomyces sp. H39-S7 TaxID=3004357 RepID=UPI0022AFA10A|nr:hypothetical protein [Streptomyces sp. H39-S7]MCZ4120249.1 hypothetical protein [Streptomyces sp. H39-S7]
MIRWRGELYTVASLDGVTVQLQPRPGSGLLPVAAPLAALAAADDFAVLDPDGQPLTHLVLPDWSLLQGVSPDAAVEARLWERHIVEIDTGVLPGRPQGSVPRPGYAPEQFTLIERYKAKAEELNAVLDLAVSWHTVQRKRLLYRQQGIWGLVDKRRVPAPSPHGRTDPRVVDTLLALVEHRARQSTITARGLFRLLRRAVRSTCGEQVKVPADSTLYTLLERLDIKVKDLRSPVRRRLDRTNRPDPPFGVSTALAPGELVQIDSTDLDVKVLGDDGQPTSAELTAMVDVCTRTLIAAVVRAKTARGRKIRQHSNALIAARRSTGRATKAVDACLLLAQGLVPAPMRPGFSPLAHASVSDLPYEDLLEADPRMAQAAARPIIIPDIIVIDHGSVFAGKAFADACQYMGISVRSARRRTPTDKAIVERTFGAVKSMFSQFVNTYTGSDISHRGRTLDGERLWNLTKLDDMVQEWIALEWQNHPHDELRNPYDPNLPPLSPNQMYSACVQAAGYLPVPLGREDYLRLLPTAWVGVRDEGITFRNRVYENPRGELNNYRHQRSGLGGKRRGGWELRYNPYTPEQVWLYDHHKNRWVDAMFRHQHLIGAPWTQYLWDIATAEHVDRGGRKDDDGAIAQALTELLERAGRGPDETATAPVPDGWGPVLPAAAPGTPFDPYASLPGGTDLPLSELDVAATGMYTLPGPADLARRGGHGHDPLLFSPAAQHGEQVWTQEAMDTFKADYFAGLPPLEEDGVTLTDDLLLPGVAGSGAGSAAERFDLPDDDLKDGHEPPQNR